METPRRGRRKTAKGQASYSLRSFIETVGEEEKSRAVLYCIGFADTKARLERGEECARRRMASCFGCTVPLLV